jgi:hypothetical protein
MSDWAMAIKVRRCTYVRAVTQRVGSKRHRRSPISGFFEMEKNRNENFKRQFCIRTFEHLRKHCHKNVEWKLFSKAFYLHFFSLLQ